MREHPRILVPPTQFGSVGNLIKICISRDSALHNETKNLFRPRKISTGKNELFGIQPRFSAKLSTYPNPLVQPNPAPIDISIGNFFELKNSPIPLGAQLK